MTDCRDSRSRSAIQVTIVLPMACAFCDDTGWKAVDDRRRPPRRAMRLLARRHRPRDCSMTRAFRRATSTATLENFVTYPNEKLLGAVRHAKRFADEFPAMPKGPLPDRPARHRQDASRGRRPAAGDPDARARAGSSTTRAICCRVIRSTYNPLVRTAEMDMLRPVMDADLLVLDDLGLGEDLRMGRGDDEPHRQHPLQRAAPDDLHLELRGYAGRRPTRIRLKVRIGFRMHSRLHEMCEFLEFDGADFRQLPPNGGVDDLSRCGR